MILSAIIAAVWAGVLIREPKWYMQKIERFGIPVGIVWMILWIILFLSRNSFAGQVCAGSYLTDEDYVED